jgi:hypothetical protein
MVNEVDLVKRDVYLTRNQDLAVRQYTKAKKIGDSELIRLALDMFFQERRQETDAVDNWFEPLIGAGISKPGHTSETIDSDLYGESKL